MKFLVLIVVLAASTSFADVNKVKSVHRAPNMSLVQMLNWDMFKTLPIEKKIQYLDEIRNFFIKQEAKWPQQDSSNAKYFIEFLMSTAVAGVPLDPPGAQAAPGTQAAPAAPTDNKVKFVNPYSDLDGPKCDQSSWTDAQTKLANEHGPWCIKGGFLVCVAPRGSDNFHCVLTDKGYQQISQSDPYKCGKNRVACAYPVFMDEKANPLCVGTNAIVKSSISQTCLAEQEKHKPDATTVKAKFDSDKTLKDKYNKIFGTVTAYCTPKTGTLWKFDKDDCTDLTKSLGNIANIADFFPNHTDVCTGTYAIKGKDYKVTFKMGSKPAEYSIEIDPQGDWKPAKCDASGKVIPDSIDKDQSKTQDTNYKACIVNKGNGESYSAYSALHFEGKSLTGPESCVPTLIKYDDVTKLTSEEKFNRMSPNGNSSLVPKDQKVGK